MIDSYVYDKIILQAANKVHRKLGHQPTLNHFKEHVDKCIYEAMSEHEDKFSKSGKYDFDNYWIACHIVFEKISK